MTISQKCQYAVRAILELSKHYGQGPMSISEISARQVIPQRFLENILSELRQGGFVESRRGVNGGYVLMIPPKDLSVGQVIRFVDGPLDPVTCINPGGQNCPLQNQCSLVELWSRAKEAVESIYNSALFSDLAEREKEMEKNRVGNLPVESWPKVFSL